MSVSNLREYARRCATESELRETARGFGLDNVGAHMDLAKSIDLEWSMQDMDAFRREMVDAEGELQNLTEEELQEVAGGVCTTTAIVAVGVGVGAAVGGVAGAAVGGAVVGGATAGGGGGW